MLLRNQKILVISPQPWDHINVSKHHYARELARQGNQVIFLDPPNTGTTDGARIDRVSEHPELKVIRYTLAIPAAVRIHARPLFDLLISRRITEFRRLAGRLDVVWCFEFNLFSDLRVFGARLNLFHPVDPVPEQSHIDVARSAHAVVSVSEQILSRFDAVPIPRLLIGHGLAPAFAREALSPERKLARTPGPARIGYAGNLSRPTLNCDVLRQMVLENPDAEFHFWGPSELPPGASPKWRENVGALIQFLEAASNVTLYGSVSTEDLAIAIQDMDCFVLSYASYDSKYDRSYPHKLLEYLSTGKVVVSSRISGYDGREELLRMAPGSDDGILPALLRDTLARLSEFNAPPLQEARRRYALDNTYEKQIDRIRAGLESRLDPALSRP